METDALPGRDGRRTRRLFAVAVGSFVAVLGLGLATDRMIPLAEGLRSRSSPSWDSASRRGSREPSR